VYDHVGNRRFRVVVALNLGRYISARTRADKSLVVNSIVEQIREASPLGGFVKQDRDGYWHEIGTAQAREKVGHTLRDCVTDSLRPKATTSDEDRIANVRKIQFDLVRTSLVSGKPGVLN
jgi:hypothetical protein